jgi:hypothetical protein
LHVIQYARGIELPTAASISIKETLALLEHKYPAVAAGIANGSYAFWLGSGISRDRVVGLDGVLAKLLEFLRSRATTAPECKFRSALDQVLDKAKPSAEELAQIDLTKPAKDWQCLPNLLKRLWNQYSAVLSVSIPGEKADYLLWTGLDFPRTFANQEADAEHLAIAMLALEGAVTDFASANWDGLIEAAVTELGYSESLFRVTVTGEDLRNPAAAAILYKFHGCALRAIAEEERYRPLLVARSAQITSWSVNEKFKIVRDQLHALVQKKRTLMVGMSAQDANIQHLFGAVNQQQGWKWSDQPTPVVFSAQELGEDQRNLLNVVYGEEAFEEHRDEIVEGARVQAYAKPLLLALLLHVLTTKIAVLAADAEAPNLNAADRARIVEGIKVLRDRVADAENDDRLLFARSIASGLARARHQLQDGVSITGAQQYFPIDDQPAHLMKGKLALKSTGQREAAAALGLIGIADSAGRWKASVDDTTASRSGALRLTSASNGSSARVFLAANDDVITNLIESGALDEDDPDAVVICSGRVTDRQQRSPRGSFRDGSITPRFVAFGPMLRSVANLDDLADRFQGEVAL